jgi:hypothetical protein
MIISVATCSSKGDVPRRIPSKCGREGDPPRYCRKSEQTMTWLGAPAFSGPSYCDAAAIVLPKFYQELWIVLANLEPRDLRVGRRKRAGAPTRTNR